MKYSAILCLSFLALATAFPAEDDVVPQDFAQDPSTHEISLEDAFLQARTMQAQKGDNACLEIAKDLKKVVATNVKALQTAQDEMGKGSNCKDSGQQGVKAAKKTLTTSKATQTAAQNAHNAASTAKVDFGSKNLNDLDPSKCAFFKMASYTAAVKKRKDTKKSLEIANGEVKSAKKGLKNAEDAAASAVLKCKCDIVTSHKTALGKRNAKAESANKKGWTKAEHLICVLEGKDMSACKVSSIPKVKAAKGLCKGCDANACATYKQSITLELPNFKTSGCAGFRVVPSTCGGGNIAYAVSKSSIWDKQQVYACPAGWHWMKFKTYNDFMTNRYKCYGNNQKAISTGTAFQNQCGWNNYKPPGATENGGGHYYFRFSDSASNNNYQHAGNYPGLVQTSASTSNFAGIVCKKN